MPCRRNNNRGQVTTEFVIMAVLVTVLAFAVLAMYRQVSSSGNTMIERVSYQVP